MRLAFAAVALLSIACRAGTAPPDPPIVLDPESPPPLAGAAARSLVAAPVVSSCGTAVVDGVLSPGEWDGAVSVRFGAAVPESAGGGEIPATLQAMSDDVNLYVAVRLELPTPAFDQSHYLELDVDRSESITHGDDVFGYTWLADRGWPPGDPMFTDAYRWDCADEGSPAVCGPPDTATGEGLAPPGTNDGGAAIFHGETFTTVELWHPYHGTDPRDLFVDPGATIAMNLSLRLLDGCPEWPRCFGDTYFPGFEGYRSLVVGCGETPDEAVVTVRIDVKPGDLLPTISLSAGGTTAVAVLGAADFDATTVNPATAWFAAAPVARREDGTAHASVEDVNGDGFADAVLQFATAALRLDVGATEATIAGATTDGREFRGTDVVRVEP
jgi:hypothetical protein